MDKARRKRKVDTVYNLRLNNTPDKLRKMSEEVSKLTLEKVEQPDLADHDSKCLDLAFVMDTTSSMSSFIQAAKNSVRKIVEEIVATENSDVRLALVEYRDHPPQDSTFVTRCHDFTSSSRTMKEWLEQSSAMGGGDLPEAVADALQDLLKLSWRDGATKIGVCISDAPPHGLGQDGDGFPDGCPNGIDPVAVANELAKNGVTLYVVGCEPSILPYKDFFMAIAHMTGGQYVSLRKAELLSKIIIGGAREEISLNELMTEVDAELQQRVSSGEVINEDIVTNALHNRWTERGQCVNQLQNCSSELDTIRSNPRAVKLSKMSSLKSVRKEFPASNSGGGGVSGFFGSLFGGWFGGSSGSGTMAGPALSTTHKDSYSCETSAVSFAQSSRLVTKGMAKYK